MEKYLQIGKYNLKYNIPLHFLVCILLLLISPLLLGLHNLDKFQTAKVLEMYVAFAGIILLPPVFLPDQNKDIRELLGTRTLSQAVVYIVRVLQAVVLLMAMVLIFIGVLKMGNCEFPATLFFLGTMSEILALGGIGMLFYSLSDQVVAGYMIPLLYYLISYGSKNKYLGKFYLFSMSEGRYDEKIYLAAAGIIFISIAIWNRCRLKR